MVAVVLDGMGGHAAGEVASELAARKILGTVTARPYEPGETWPEHWKTDRSAAGNLIVDAVLRAHVGVTEAVDANPDLKGMGTTVVAGVTPGREGQEVHGAPVYHSVRRATAPASTACCRSMRFNTIRSVVI